MGHPAASSWDACLGPRSRNREVGHPVCWPAVQNCKSGFPSGMTDKKQNLVGCVAGLECGFAIRVGEALGYEPAFAFCQWMNEIFDAGSFCCSH